MVALVFLAFLVGVAVVVGVYYTAVQLPGRMQQRRLDARLMEVTRPFARLMEVTRPFAGPREGPRFRTGSTSRVPASR